VVVQRLQHFDPVREPHLRAVWTWMCLLSAAGVGALTVCVACLVVFYLRAHLGWTMLSNQAAIVAMRLLAGFYEARVRAAVGKINNDQHKVIIIIIIIIILFAQQYNSMHIYIDTVEKCRTARSDNNTNSCTRTFNKNGYWVHVLPHTRFTALCPGLPG